MSRRIVLDKITSDVLIVNAYQTQSNYAYGNVQTNLFTVGVLRTMMTLLNVTHQWCRNINTQ